MIILLFNIGYSCAVETILKNSMFKKNVCTELSQRTRPSTLPIIGNIESEITLQIASSTRPVFRIVDKQLELISLLDRDTEDISSIILQVYRDWIIVLKNRSTKLM